VVPARKKKRSMKKNGELHGIPTSQLFTGVQKIASATGGRVCDVKKSAGENPPPKTPALRTEEKKGFTPGARPQPPLSKGRG